MEVEGLVTAYTVSPGAPGVSAVEAWAEAFIIQAARLGDPQHPLARGIRIRGIRAHLQPPGGPDVATVQLRPDRCWTSDEQLLAPLFQWESWRALKDYLLDHGIDEADIDEQVDPTQLHSSRTSYLAVDEFVSSHMSAPLKTSILDYFTWVTAGYLAAWQPLTSHTWDTPPRTLFAFDDLQDQPQ